MTRNMIFGGILAGAIALIGVSSLFSENDNRNRYDDDGDTVRIVVNGEMIVPDGSVVIERRGDYVFVNSKNGRVNCTKNGGSVIVDRKGGNKLEVICD